MSQRQFVVWLSFAVWSLAALASGCASVSSDSSEGLFSLSKPSGVRQASYESGEDDDSRLTWSDFNVDNLGSTAKKLAGQGPNRELAKTLFLEADDLFRQAMRAGPNQRAHLFELAAPKYAAAADRWPDSQLAMDGRFMAAESYFFADNYHQAGLAYEKLVKEFPNNRYMDQVDQRRFLMARFWVDINRNEPEPFYYFNWTSNARPWRDARGHGLRVFNKICIDDPTGRLADDATLAAANEYFASGEYEKADEKYADLRQAYPSSEHQFNAHFLGLKAKLLCYQGPAYGGTLLDEAEKLVKQIRRQFPQEAERERDFLDRAAAEIRFRQAERLAYLGNYHDRRSEYRAAQHYYSQVVRDYNDTPLAQRSQERIGQIAGLPAVPPQQAQFLVNLLPESDKIKPLIAASQKAQQEEMERAAILAAQQPIAPSFGGAPQGDRTVNDPNASAVMQAQAAGQEAAQQNQRLAEEAAQNPGGFPNVLRAFPFFR